MGSSWSRSVRHHDFSSSSSIKKSSSLSLSDRPNILKPIERGANVNRQLAQQSFLPALTEETYSQAKLVLAEAQAQERSDSLLPYASQLVMALMSLKAKENLTAPLVGEILVFLHSPLQLADRLLQPEFAISWATQLAESKFLNFVPNWILDAQMLQLPSDHLHVRHAQLTLEILRDTADLAPLELVRKICRFGLIGKLLGFLTKETFTAENVRSSPTLLLIGTPIVALLHICLRHHFEESRRLVVVANGVARVVQLVGGPTDTREQQNLQLAAKCKMLAAAVLAYIVPDDQIVLLSSPVSVIRLLAKTFRSAIDGDEGSQPADGLSLQNLLEAMLAAAANDGVKVKFAQIGTVESLWLFIQQPHRNETELTAAMRVVWTLSFCQQTHNRIKNAEGLMAKVEDFSRAENESMSEAAGGVLWNVRQQFDDEYVNQTPLGYILLSYSRDYLPLARRLNKFLQSAGHKTLLGQGDGSYPSQNPSQLSMAQKMASAVSQAQVVLVFFSESYKNSRGCRMELDWANRQGRQLIPIRTEQKYTADGWLRDGLGVSVPLECCGLDEVNSAAISLAARLKEIWVKPEPPESQPQNSAENQQSANRPVSDWTAAEVHLWLDSLALKDFNGSLKDLNGRQLEELHSMYQRAPTSFYEILQKDLNVTTLHDILDFSISLTSLFSSLSPTDST